MSVNTVLYSNIINSKFLRLHIYERYKTLDRQNIILQASKEILQYKSMWMYPSSVVQNKWFSGIRFTPNMIHMRFKYANDKEVPIVKDIHIYRRKFWIVY